ncbi:MAG: hypothetical protein DHS20C15_14350 [Planctomycetota bacterium]|nr:MAG: hypothetical protein DHS20C15_14350 [Planctomycetota bacterium]
MNTLLIALAMCLLLLAPLGAQQQDAPPAPEGTSPPSPVSAPAETGTNAGKRGDSDSDNELLAAAHAELTALAALIESAPDDENWPHWSMWLRDKPETAQQSADMHPVVQASAHLVIFETRFGVRAQELPGWRNVREASAASLSVFAVRAAEREEFSPAMVWTRAFLEYASGDPAAARVTLLGDHPRVVGGCCYGHEDESRYWLAAARAVMLDLLGDTESARLWYHAACYWYWSDLRRALAFDYHRVMCDLVLARYAEHLVAIDAAGGAARVLESLTEHWSGTLGQRFAERAVRPRLPSEVAASHDLFALKAVEFQEDWTDPTGLLFLLGDPNSPAEARVLAGIIPYEAPPGATLIDTSRGDMLAVGADDPRLRARVGRLANASTAFVARGHLTQDPSW